MLCVKCRSVSYCSIGCKQADWPTHKLLCNSDLDSFRVRPGPMYKRAILFPVELGKIPEFIWMEVTSTEESDTCDQFESPKLSGLLEAGNRPVDRQYFQHNILRDRTLDHTIEVVHRSAFLRDGSLPNESIRTATRGVHVHPWAGPIIAFRKKGTNVHAYDDIRLRDFRDTVDFFITYNNSTFNNDTSNNERLTAGVEKVRGVRINCDADQRMLGADKYFAVDVADSHTIFAYQDVIAISRMIELPILVRKCAPNEAWNLNNTRNEAATFLKLDLDPTSNNFGWAPSQWQERVGSVLAVREDLKTLSPHLMEALCYFCQFKICQFQMQPLTGAGTVERTRESVLQQLTKAEFQKFFSVYRGQRIAGDLSWVAIPCPYVI